MHRRVHARVALHIHRAWRVRRPGNENGTSTPEQARLPRARGLAEAEPASAAV